jgi:1-aminocyclopropane-1-carboxylate deaminase/D-cysteine desulfhydrase-like pyridoxal-dependent ACC family enzyme
MPYPSFVIPDTNDTDIAVTISAKNAMLKFQGCTKDYILSVCHGRCCWVTTKDKKVNTTIYVEEDQRAPLESLGASLDSGVISVGVDGKCVFQTCGGLCSLQNKRAVSGAELKPRSCYISPWILTKNSKLIIRNRYKLLRCFKAPGSIPVYKAFNSGLVMLFGADEAAKITKHFDDGGGDYKTILCKSRELLVRHVMSTWHNEYYAESHTPVERHGDIWVKRDDLACGGLGAKARAVEYILRRNSPSRVVTCGGRASVQIMVCAKVCQTHKIPCFVHVPAGKDTAELKQVRKMGTTIIVHRPGYLTVIRKRASQDVCSRGGTLIPFGLLCSSAVNLVREQVANLPSGVNRIVVCGGSGTTAAGILLGTKEKGIPIVVVEVGMGVKNNIERLVGSDMDMLKRITIVAPKTSYSTPANVSEFRGLKLDPFYEAKCIPQLMPGDLLWVTAHRSVLLCSKRERL